MGNSSATYKVRDPTHEQIRLLDQFISTGLVYKLHEECVEKNLELSEQTDDPHSNLLLGYYYQHGFGVNRRDLKKAYKYYHRAAEQLHPTGQYMLYQLYGSSTARRKTPCIKTLPERQLAQLKVPLYVSSASKDICSSPAHKELKRKVYNSRIWKKEVVKLKIRMKRTVESEPDRIVDIGATLYNELGYLLWILNEEKSSEQYQLASDYFRKAGELGNAAGYYNMANIIHHVGHLIGMQGDEAREYLVRAAENGHARAQFLIGYEAFYSKITDDDDRNDNYNIAFNYLGMSSKFPFADTLCLLGQLHYHGLGGIRQDFKVAKEHFEKAVTSIDYEDHDGKMLGNFFLGFMHEKGIGCEKDYTIAAHYYAIAAKMNYNMAYCRLAKMLEKNRIPNSDVIAAERFYKFATDSNEHDAASYANYRLGKIYSNSKYGVLKDDSKARQCFQSVQANHFFSSKINDRTTTWSDYHIGCMHQHGFGIAGDEGSACDYYRNVVNKAKSTYSIIGRHYLAKAIKKLNTLGFPIGESMKVYAVYENIPSSDAANLQLSANNTVDENTAVSDDIHIEENQVYVADDQE